MADTAKAEQRRHPRLPLYATVELRAAGEVLVLAVRNISLGGAFLSSDAEALVSVRVGSEEDVLVFDGSDEELQIVVRARIVRKQNDGIALAWVGEDAVFKVARLLEVSES
ncbi:MAG TPA: PilZ domain-containing protein [Polyangia bacterium]